MTTIDDKFRGEIASAVRSLLGEQRKTVVELASFLHLSRPTTSDRVNGGSAFTADELGKVSVFFGLTSVYVLFDVAEAISKRNALAVSA